MASIYDYTTSKISENLLPVKYRIVKVKAWLICLLFPLQYLRDIIFNEYYMGSTAAAYNNGTAYVIGDKVRYTDGKIYEAIAATTGNKPITANIGVYWYKVADDYRGAYARARYSAQKLVLEYVLNEFFATTFRQPNSDTSPTRSDIYVFDTKPLDWWFVFKNDTRGSPFINGNLYTNKFIINDPSASVPTARIVFIPESGGSPRPGFWTSLGATDAIRTAKVRNLCDRYMIAGCIYDVQHY